MSGTPARISLVGEGVLYGSGGYDVFLQNITVDPVFTVKHWRAGQLRDVVSLVLAPSTVGASGIPFRGPNQAKPLWAARSGCVVASDGESRWLAVSSLDAERVDTMALPSGVEVIRVSLATGRAVLDTVPCFPIEFGEPGVYYATTRDDLGRVIIERYDLGGTGEKTLVAGAVRPE